MSDFSASFRRKRPLLIRGFAAGWPALDRWDFKSLAAWARDATATVEIGNVLRESTELRVTSVADYIRALELEEEQASVEPRAYLSIFDFFTVYPHLRADVDFTPLIERTLWHTMFGWIGPSGTETAYHVDWIDNILVQIRGRKQVSLVSPADSSAMEPSPKFDYRTTISGVDPDAPERHPAFARLRPWVCELGPGDGLYIPRGWWHRVVSLAPSISVNAFGHDLLGVLYYQPRASIQLLLHRLGVYRTATCTCHQIIEGRRVPRLR